MIKLPFDKPTLTHYELILTENCNFRCKYCFDNSFSDRTSCNYDYVMSLEKIPDLINFIEVTHAPLENPGINFFGGEPTLNWEFIQGFIAEVEKRNLHYSYHMNTNASLLTPEKVDYLVFKRVGLVLSLDGTQESHNATRTYANQKGTWLDIMKILPNLTAKYSATHLPLTAMMVVDKNNFQNLEKNYQFLLTLGFLDVNILWNYDIEYSEEEYKIIKDQLISLFQIKRVPMYLDLKRRILNPDYQDTKKHGHYCQTVENNVTINPKGQLFFCHRLTPKMAQVIEQENYPESFGNIYEGYINTDYLNLIYDRVDINLSQKSECLECQALPFCKGGCIGAIRDNTGGYDHLDSLCKLNKNLAEVFYSF